ncbi:CDP-glycerol glycerophosphotransferase family protein [Glutamicibacter sp. 0426]|uniref:CDP-glycerol glycerophosphotransferase family protein n=1 Tax=Glutamicibacter sp. 0426 TaxID=1913445 RepID=UPI000939D7CE|nr:CDP-glycerol glycerophosphotransferase family protein [Glutamicibacter sp. 0426]
MKVLKTLNNAATYAGRRLVAQQHRKFINRHATELFHAPSGEDRYQVALYFADAMVNAYQIRQWYEPLKQLAKRVPVVIITRLPESALALREECAIPVHYAPTIEDVEKLVNSQDLRVVFYVNQNIRNFQMMRFNAPDHVFISHGESEKAYMWSNQLKAYDYVFSAGQAARDRLGLHLRNFDAGHRTRLIGRPQIDVDYLAPYSINHSLPTVLYAPTWEGDRPSMNYGSLLSHGEGLIDALIKDGGFNIIFRPHPRSGINSAQYGQAVERVRDKLNSANSTATGRLLFDDTTHWGWQWVQSDICITDISAVAYDFLATGKPMFVTTPVSEEATISDSPALSKVPSLAAAQSADSPALIRSALLEENAGFKEVVEYYFGDVAKGASMQRFIDESLNLVNGHAEVSHFPGRRAA